MMLLRNIFISTLWIGVFSDSLSSILRKRSVQSSSPLVSGLMARSLNQLLTMSQGDSEEESNVSEEQSENAEPIITTRSSAILPSFRNHFYPRLHIANRLPTIQSTQPPTTQSPAATTRHRSSFSLRDLYVHVVIVQPTEILRVSVAFSPDNLSLYAYIRQAGIQNEYNNGWNFQPRPGGIRSAGCSTAPISTIGGVSGPWLLKVTNQQNQILHESICLPLKSVLPMRLGYTITATKLNT